MPNNLQEIAKLSGVSRSTVSRVLNNDPNVKTETRERVEAIMRQVNFQPNAAARGLASGHTRILGLVIPQGVSSLFTDPYFPLLIQGISTACNTHDYSVMLWLAEPEYERRTIGKVVNSGLIDGVILSSVWLADPVLEALRNSAVPFLMVGRHPTDTQVHYVDVDNFSSAQTGTLHLLRLGRQRVATITGPLNMIAAIDRRDGYVQALRDRGFAAQPELMVESDFTEAGGYLAMQRLLPHHPDAVFAASDMMAAGALRALRDHQLSVPEQVAVVGFDDIPFASHTIPPLTTLRQPIQRMGAVAAETLIEIIGEASQQPRRIVLPTELVIRSSCGANL